MESLRFGRHQHLIGILHQPEKANGRAVIFWNTGISGRAGPYRLNVELARALAQNGFTVLRFDLSQLGDSQASQDDLEVQARSSADLKDALDWVEARTGIDDFVLYGLCSSAIDAYYFAQNEARVRALVMIDGLVYPTRDHALRLKRMRLLSPFRWLTAFKKKILGIKGPDIPLDFFESNYPAPEIAARDLQAMIDQGRDFLCIYTGGFTPYFTHRSQFFQMLPGFKGGKNLDLRVWPEVDHLFLLEEDRKQLIETSLAWLSTHGERPKAAVKLLEVSAEKAARENVPTNPPDNAPVAAAAPESKTDPKSLLASFKLILQSRVIEEEDSFFDYGGNSVLALKVVEQLDRSLGLKIPLVALYSYNNAVALAAAIDRGEFAAGFASTEAPTAKALDSADDIAIIGMACVVPGAEDIDAFWEMILAGREGIRHFAREELDPSLPEDLREAANYIPSRGVIAGDQFDAEFFKLNRREAMLMDPQQRVLLQVAWSSLEDAAYAGRRKDLKIAVYAGVGASSYLSRNLMQGHVQPHSEEEALALMLNDKDYVATRVAYHLDLKGPAISVHTACSTSLVAIIEAVRCLQSGQADIAIAAAAAVNAPMASGQLHQDGGIYSKDGHCRPFDAKASGTMFSDGAVSLVLKSLRRAEADGDRIHAVIKGVGINNDGSDKSSFAAPSVNGQLEAIRMAIGSLDPESVGLVEAHGTATPVGDPIEVEALRRAYGGNKKQYCALTSVKAHIGHLTAAAGGIGLIKAALCVRENLIPAQLHFETANPNLRLEQTPFFVPKKAQAWPLTGKRRAAVSSFGVGGTNSHIIIEEAPARDIPERVQDDPFTVIAWSAKSLESAQALGEKVKKSQLHPQDLSYTLDKTRAPFPFAQALCVVDGLPMRNPGVVWPRANKKKALVFCFAGQGSHYVGMSEELSRIWPRFAQNHRALRKLFQQDHGIDIAVTTEKLETRLAQPAIFALEWALAQSFLEIGLDVQALLGHSLGEVTAAVIAGVFDLRSAATFVAKRAAIMQLAKPGSMLAVRASLDSLTIPEDLDLAAVNGPQAVVVAGPSDKIRAYQAELEAKDIPAKILQASHAFHSRMMDPMLDTFEKSIAALTFHRPTRKLISTVTGKTLAAADAMSPAYWVRQIRQPVRFADALQTAKELYPDAFFVEIGPKDALTKFVQQILNDKNAAVPALPHRGETEADGIAALIEALCCAGHRPFAVENGLIVSAPTYAFKKDRYWLAPKTESQAIGSDDEAEEEAMNGEGQRLLELMGDLLGQSPGSLSLTAPWTELGMDSLMLTQWALKLQREFKLEMNLQKLQKDVPHLEALLAMLPQSAPRVTTPRAKAMKKLAPAPAPLPDASWDDASLELVKHVMDQQFQLMNRQLDMLQSFAGKRISADAPPFAPAKPKELNPLELMAVEGEHRFLRDSGTVSAPKLKGSFLAQDEGGEASVYIEDPENPGQFWQIVHDSK